MYLVWSKSALHLAVLLVWELGKRGREGSTHPLGAEKTSLKESQNKRRLVTLHFAKVGLELLLCLSGCSILNPLHVNGHGNSTTRQMHVFRQKTPTGVQSAVPHLSAGFFDVTLHEEHPL